MKIDHAVNSPQDTFRAEHSLLTLFAPERVNSMMRSLLRIYDYSGRLPMWANIVETNIMIGTHVDAVLANAISRNFTSFNITKAWEAVRKNAFIPPLNDTDLLYYDREPYTPDEARAGLTAYSELGYVPNDQWAESASRTLDYAFDDHAAAIAVRDYGVGLAPGEAALVFNRFWRADPARARTSGGTGLGLSISLEDTHLHGGWLQAWGMPGRGAQFRLTLPRRAGAILRQSPLPLVPEDAEDRSA